MFYFCLTSMSEVSPGRGVSNSALYTEGEVMWYISTPGTGSPWKSGEYNFRMNVMKMLKGDSFFSSASKMC